MTDYTHKCGSCVHFCQKRNSKVGNCKLKQELSGKVYTSSATRKACGRYGIDNFKSITAHVPAHIEQQNACGWSDRNGICQNEKKYIHTHSRIKCTVANKCGWCISPEELAEKHNRTAHDRPLTPLTRRLVCDYYAEGDSVLTIAISLNRSTAVIERILRDEGINSL